MDRPSLVDYLDEIPRFMAQLRKENRGLQGGDSIGDIENTNNANNGIISSCRDEKIVNNKENQVPNLVDQARKLKEYIDSEVLNVVSSEDNDIAQLATKALHKLQNYQSNIDVTNEKSFYRAYDTNKSGMIGYDDFKKTLSISNCGITNSDVDKLCQKMDTNLTGQLKYTDINRVLKELSQNTVENKKNIGNIDNRQGSASVTAIENTHNQIDGAVESTDRIDNKADAPPPRQDSGDSNDDDFFNWKKNRYAEDTYGDRYVEKKRYHKNSWSIRGLNGHIKLQEVGECVNRKNNSYQVRLLMQSNDVSDGCDTYYDSNTGTRRKTLKKYFINQCNNSDLLRRSINNETCTHSTTHRRARSAPPTRSTMKDVLTNNTYYTRDDTDLKMSPIDSKATRNTSVQRIKRQIELYNNLVNKVASGQGNNDPYESIADDIKKYVAYVNDSNEDTDSNEVVKNNGVDHSTRVKLAENAICSHLKGHFGQLHHALKRIDRSNSGCVNYSEFRSTIASTGAIINDNDLQLLYQDYISTPVKAITTTSMDYGAFSLHSNNSYLNINDFITKMRVKAMDNTSGFTTIFNSREIRDMEKRRVYKNILHTTNKHSDPLLVFKDIAKMNGQQHWVYPAQFKEGLKLLNVDLSEAEVNKLIETLDSNGEGKVNLLKFDNFLRDDIDKYEKTRAQTRVQELASHSRYHQSYRSDISLHHSAQSEYYPYNNTRSAKEQFRNWIKLKHKLWNHHDDILQVFSRASDTHRSKQRGVRVQQLADVPINELQSKLAEKGIRLGSDDLSLLTHHLQHDALDKRGYTVKSNTQSLENHFQEGSNDTPGSVSLSKFSEVVGIPMSTRSQKVVLTHPKEVVSENGIFNASHEASLSSNATNRTTYHTNQDIHLPGTVQCHMDSPSNFHYWKKRSSPIVLPHTYQPSKFWEMKHSGEPLNRLWSYYSPVKGTHQRQSPPPLPVMSKRVNNQQYVSGDWYKDVPSYVPLFVKSEVYSVNNTINYQPPSAPPHVASPKLKRLRKPMDAASASNGWSIFNRYVN